MSLLQEDRDILGFLVSFVHDIFTIPRNKVLSVLGRTLVGQYVKDFDVVRIIKDGGGCNSLEQEVYYQSWLTCTTGWILQVDGFINSNSAE